MTLSAEYTEYSIHRVQHTPSTAYTEYSIHRVQHTLSTAYTACCIIPRSTVSRSQPVSHLSADYVCTQFSTFPQLQVNQWIESQLPSHLPPELLPPDWPPPSTPPISLDHSLRVHLQTRSITASNCIFKLTRLQPPSASPVSVNDGLQVHLQIRTASMCMSALARLGPPNSHDRSLQLHPQTRYITATKYFFQQRRRVYWDTGVTEVDRVTGSIFSADPGVDRYHLISISSYHTMKIQTLSFPTFGLTHSVREISWSHTIAWILNAG